MNFAEMTREVADRGFSDVPWTRLERWVNQSYLELCETRRWPFLETTASGTTPLTISDLGGINWVRIGATDKTLYHEDRHDLIRRGADPGDAGTPTRYYILEGTRVAIYPTDAAVSITVLYWKRPAELTLEGQESLIPVAFHDLIILGAVRRGYESAGDLERAAATEATRQAGLQIMISSTFNAFDRDPDREERGKP